MFASTGAVGRIGRHGISGGAKRPSFSVDFVGSGSLGTGAVFTRASSGTYYDSAGILRTSPINLVRNSMMVGGVAPTTLPTLWEIPQLITGGGNSTTYAYGTSNGVPYMDLIVSVITPLGGATPIGIIVENTLPSGTGVTLTGAVTYQLVAGAIPAGATFNSVLWYQPTTGFISGLFTPTTTPQRIITTGSAVASDTGCLLFISIGCPAALTYTFTLRISQPQVERGSVATTFIPTTTATSGAPRFDYDPVTLQLKGLLLEDASTNIAAYSGDISQVNWGKYGNVVAAPTVTANQAIAPDGTLTASRVVYPAVTANPQSSVVYQAPVVTATQWTLSVWLRGNVGGEQLYLSMNAAGVFYSSPRLTLTTSWQRFSFTSPSPLTAVGWTWDIGTDFRDPTLASTPAQTVFIWGAQFEALPYMSSHIPTTSASVTRAADFLSYPIASVAGFSTTQGSLAHDYILEASFPSYGAPAQFIGANPNTDFIVPDSFTTPLQTPASQQLAGAGIMVAGVNVANSDGMGILVPVNTIQRGAIAWKLNAQLNSAHDAVGLPVLSGPPASLPVVTNLTVAGPILYQPMIPQWARRTRYWPRQLSQAELISATTLDGPTLSLDFMQPGTLDPRITFTRASSATYTDASGVVQTAATNAPRWDYASGVLRGLLIEEQRTNIMPGSIPINGPWVPSAATVTAASGIAPDGTNTMVRMAETAANTLHFTSVGMGFAGGGNWTGSVYAKAAELRYFQFVLDDGGANAVYATFDLVGGTITGPVASTGTAVAVSASMQAVGNGIYRCSIVTTPVGTALRTMLFTANVGSPGKFPSYAGNAANGLLVWGVDIEQGAFPTSYIPTTSVSVTRAADVAVMPTNVSWYSQSTGSVVIEHAGLPGTAAGISSGLVAFDDNSGNVNNHIMVFSFGIVGQSVPVSQSMVGGVSSAYANYGAITTLPVVKRATKWANNGVFSQTANGLAVQSLTNTGVPSNVSRMQLGPQFAGVSQPNGYIRRVTYWNRALSDAEMQQVTT